MSIMGLMGVRGMKYRKWDAQTKVQVVLEGLKGKAVSEVCTEYEISQSQYYIWRDQFLANAGKAFEVKDKSRRESRLERENGKLKALVGELTYELKKIEDC